MLSAPVLTLPEIERSRLGSLLKKILIVQGFTLGCPVDPLPAMGLVDTCAVNAKAVLACCSMSNGDTDSKEICVISTPTGKKKMKIIWIYCALNMNESYGNTKIIHLSYLM